MATRNSLSFPFTNFISLLYMHINPQKTPSPLSNSQKRHKSHFSNPLKTLKKAMALNSNMAISPRKLRYDVYSYTYQNDSKTPLVISVLASLIERSLARNERISRRCGGRCGRIGVFDCHETPDMTVQAYLERIFRYTRAGPSVYVVAYVYIDRFCRSQPEFRITARNVHRLLITTVMVASKYVEDMNYRNSYFARVGGISTKEMNNLELEFLFLMNFKMHVNVSVFESYCCHLQREVSIGGGYHIEKTLRCAEEIKSRQKGYDRIARITL